MTPKRCLQRCCSLRTDAFLFLDETINSSALIFLVEHCSFLLHISALVSDQSMIWIDMVQYWSPCVSCLLVYTSPMASGDVPEVDDILGGSFLVPLYVSQRFGDYLGVDVNSDSYGGFRNRGSRGFSKLRTKTVCFGCFWGYPEYLGNPHI